MLITLIPQQTLLIATIICDFHWWSCFKLNTNELMWHQLPPFLLLVFSLNVLCISSEIFHKKLETLEFFVFIKILLHTATPFEYTSGEIVSVFVRFTADFLHMFWQCERNAYQQMLTDSSSAVNSSFKKCRALSLN